MKATEGINNSQKKCLQTTRRSAEYCTLKRKKPNPICRKKNVQLESGIKETELARRKNKKIKFFKIKNFNKGPTNHIIICKRAQNNIVSEKEHILKTWQQHFSSLLNCRSDNKNNNNNNNVKPLQKS